MLDPDQEILEKIEQFKTKVKVTFMEQHLAEVTNTLSISDEQILAFDGFNISLHNKANKAAMLKCLLEFYRSEQNSFSYRMDDLGERSFLPAF